MVMTRPKDKTFWLHTAVFSFVVSVLLNQLAYTGADPDLWGYLAFGRLFWQSGQFPYQDVFSFVPTLNPWVYHEWLTGVLFYPLYLKLGGFGLQALKYVLALGTMALLFLTARLRGAEAVSAWLGIWFVQFLFIYGYSPVRAQIFTYFFFALSLYVLEKARLPGNRRWLALLIFLPIPWCNLHGGFLAGLGLIALYGLGEALARRAYLSYLLTLLLAGLATLINPYGLNYWSYIFHAITMPRPQIHEWASLWTVFHTGQQKIYLLYIGLTMAFAICLGIRTKGQEITPWLVLAVTGFLGVKHQRHLVFFLLAAGAYLPVFLNTFFEKWSPPPWVASWRARVGLAWPTAFLTALSLATVCWCLNKSPWTLEVPSRPGDMKQVVYYPTGALAFLQAHQLSGRLLTEFDWGEYLLWNLFPQCRVALDGRFETVYPPEVCQKYWDFKYGEQNWRRMIDDYQPDLILIYTQSKAYPLLSREPGWQEVYADAHTALFRRENKTSQPKIASFP